MLRSALYVVELALRRLGRASGATALVVLGIALGAAVVVGVRAGTTVAQDRAVAQAVERIPEGSRSIRAVWFGVPGQSDEPQPALDARARAALRNAGAPEPHALVLYRETTVAGDFAGLGGVEGWGAGSSSAPAVCRASAARGGVRSSGCAARAGCRLRRGCGSSRWARPRSRRACSSATSWLRPTTLSPTPR